MLGMYLALIDEQTDKEKFAEIYGKYKDMMFYKAMSILHNKTLAEDAVQESFIKIARNIINISQVDCSKTVSFIVIIVRNTCFDILKKEKKTATLPFDDNIEIPNVELPNIEQVISSGGFNGIVSAIGDLDKIYSDAMKLKYIYGYSSKEIAGILNVSDKCVQMRIYRGKQLLNSGCFVMSLNNKLCKCQ